MPAMMGNQPMKDSYVGGLEKSVADKVSDTGMMKRQRPPYMKPPVSSPKMGGDRKKIGKMVERMYKMPGR